MAGRSAAVSTAPRRRISLALTGSSEPNSPPAVSLGREISVDGEPALLTLSLGASRTRPGTERVYDGRRLLPELVDGAPSGRRVRGRSLQASARWRF